MALMAKSPETIIAMSPAERWQYFVSFSQYFKESPRFKYAIRIGSKTLRSHDTGDLRLKFESYVANLKRRFRRQENNHVSKHRSKRSS